MLYNVGGLGIKYIHYPVHECIDAVIAKEVDKSVFKFSQGYISDVGKILKFLMYIRIVCNISQDAGVLDRRSS
jgi:hypothetical protein